MKFINFIYFFTLFFIVSATGQNGKEVLSDSIDYYLDIADAKNLKNDIKASFHAANKAIDLAQRLNDTKALFHAYNIVGIGYEMIEDYKNAEKNYQKALAIAKIVENDTLILWEYNNLGNVYTEGYKEIDKGISMYNKAIIIAKENNIEGELITPNLNIGWTYIDEGEYDKALPFLNNVQKLAGKNKDYCDAYLTVEINYLFGKYHTSKKQYSKALDHFKISIDTGETIKRYDLLKDVYLAQSELYEYKGDSKNALLAYKKYDLNRKKVFDNDKARELEIAKAKFDLDEFERNLKTAREEKEFQERIAQKSKLTTIIAIITAFILVVLLVILYDNYKTKTKLSNILKGQNENLAKSKEEAEKLSQLKTQFISTVSHELRTPLYGVVGITSLLIDEGNLSNKENHYLKSLKFSGDYLLNLINDVLQLSKIESNTLVLDKKDFNIKLLLKNVADSFEYLLDQKENTLHLKIDEDVPTLLKGDNIRLQQILINLVGNSIKFTDNGNIWLTAKLLEKKDETVQVHFEIRDTGIGIPKDKQKEIFENFSQIDRNDPEYQGTGLGLSIVKKLVTFLGGDIVLESEVGKGAKFSFSIVFDEVKNSMETANLICETEKNYPHKKILIVDDNKINQLVTINILKKRKFKTTAVDNGEQAVEMVKENDYDLILMDLNMPVMNGYEACKAIRKFNKTIPIIALTAVAVDEVRQEVINAGLNDIINKPYENQEFYNVIFRNIIND